MKTKTFLAVENAGGVNFALQAGQPIELGPDLAKDLVRAGFVVEMKKGLTLPEAVTIAKKHRETVLADLAAQSAPPAAPPAAPVADPDAQPKDQTPTA